MSAAPLMSEALKYKVTFQRGPLSGQSFVFSRAVIQVGRGTENDLVLTNDLRASRVHAEIRWDGEHLKVVNVSTKNFVAVNGSQEDSAILENGSIVVVGESEFRVEFNLDEGTSVLDEPKTKLVVVEPPPISPLIVNGPPPARFLDQTAPAPMAAAQRPPPQPMSSAVSSAMPQHSAAPPRQHVPRAAKGSLLADPKVRFYAIVAVIGLALFWLLTSSGAKKKELTFRSAEQIEKDVEASREEIKEFEARKDKLDNVQYRRAQENYIRGFRDYKQGNYGRARESFQVVLNLDPDNDLAKRYYHLSKVKFDEMVKFHMLQGNRYREKKNWRMCKSSYFNVMTMLNNGQDPLFKEAKQYFEQCTLALQGTY